MHAQFAIRTSVVKLRTIAMWGIPERQPFNYGPYKLWPCFSRPEFQWFAAIEGSPHYFRSLNEAKLFIKDLVSNEDPENLCD
jgi:hypothetical protein